MDQNHCNAFKNPAFEPRAQRTSEVTAPQQAVAVRQGINLRLACQAPSPIGNACPASCSNPANDCDIQSPTNPADLTAQRPGARQSFSNRNYEAMLELGLIATCCALTLYSLAQLL